MLIFYTYLLANSYLWDKCVDGKYTKHNSRAIFLFFVFVSFFSTTPQCLSRSTKDWIITKVIHVLNEHISVMKNKVSYVLICKAPAQIQLKYFIFKLEACLKTTQKCRWKIFVDCTVYCHKSWKYHWNFWTKNQNFFFLPTFNRLQNTFGI